jgi:hypothetical protein
MKRRFQEYGIQIATASQTILMQIPISADTESESSGPVQRRATA